MASIKLSNIVKTYEDGVTVIEDLNLEIKDKEFVILVGPSGCGKSTTLRMIAGLEDATSGEIRIGNKVVNNVHPKDRDIAMVFQSYALYPHMSVYKNMAFGLTLRKMDKTEIDKKVRHAAKILEIEKYLNRKPRALSGGQRQRVALGRAMVRDPAVFLLDEPLSNLDAKLRAEMRSQIIKLHNDLKTTFVYVTHDQTEAMTMADRIVVMKDGVIMQVDTPSNIYLHPQNTFVAGFIGSPQMNFLNAEITEKGGNICAKIEDKEIPLPDRMQKKDKIKEYINRAVIFGIRPEDFHTQKKYALDDESNKVEVTVDISEMMGYEMYLYAIFGKQEITAKTLASQSPLSNEKTVLYIDMQKSHIFDKETKQLICD